MKILVTAGATQTPIDKVRAITNIFHGKTGAHIARAFVQDHVSKVTLITSMEKPALCATIGEGYVGCINVIYYRTYDELYAIMEREITTGGYDVVIHSAAVSDYKPTGVFAPDIDGRRNFILRELDSSGKIGSFHSELFLRLVPTVKIVDKIVTQWGFRGILVKFKLQVGMTDGELLHIADRSMRASQADIMVANCLEWCSEKAYILTNYGDPICVQRKDLPCELRQEIERQYENKKR